MKPHLSRFVLPSSTSCFSLASILTLVSFTQTAHAHYIPSRSTPITLNTSLVATWRSHNVVEENEYWQIPGTNMGGDAWPVEKGITVDEMQLGLGVRMDANTYAIVEVGTHASGSEDHSGVSLEHAYLGITCCEEFGPWVLEVGRMSGMFSPSLSEHASHRLSSESALINDVFFGRNFHDDGARIIWHSDSLIAGIEVWKGDTFPATAAGDQSWDVFARYQWQNQNIKFTAGAFSYHASAEARSDHRYGGGHQHTPIAAPGETATQFADTRFTGNTDTFGINTDIAYLSDNQHWQSGIKAEYMAMHMDGDLHDAIGRAASVDAEQTGLWAQPYIVWKDHTFAVRAEWLTSDNEIAGAPANQLSINSGMANANNFEPSRYSAIWLWQWRENVAFRTEVIEDNSLEQSSLKKDNLRFGIGVIWKQSLWPFK